MAALACAACQHDTMPATTVDTPKSSKTPVGFLLDGTAQLHLRADQTKTLRDIDKQLDADLDPIDKRIHDVMHPAFANPRRDAVPDVKGRIGDAKRLLQERETRIDNALHRALDALETVQRPVAVKILHDHDIDIDDDEEVDTGSAAGSGSGSDVSGSRP